MARLFIGLMSGTSVDAIDAVLMDFSAPNPRLVEHFSEPLDAELKSAIHRIISVNAWPQDTATLDAQLVTSSVQAIQGLLGKASVRADEVQAVGSHGQTVFHDPGGTPAVSVQLGDAGEIARLAGIPTVGNFRQADLDAGGQGAPLACAYHARGVSQPTRRPGRAEPGRHRQPHLPAVRPPPGTSRASTPGPRTPCRMPGPGTAGDLISTATASGRAAVP